KSCAPCCGCHSPRPTAKLKQFADLFESGGQNSRMYACAKERSSATDFKSRAEAAHSTVASGSFRRPGVRSGGAVRRPAGRPRLAPLPVAEWVVTRASPSLARDAFSTDDSSRNMKSGFDGARFHRARLNDRGTRAESNQSPAPHTLAAKGIAA